MQILCLQKNASHESSETKINGIGELIHTDVCGPMENSSLNNSRYFLLLKDNYSNYRHVYFLKAKAEVVKCFKNYLIKVKKETGNEISALHSDNGREFINEQMTQILFNHGIGS